MKKLIVIAIAVAVVFTATLAVAQDKLVTAKVSKVTIAKDKHGNEYVRLSVDNSKELNGVEYTTTASAMAFGDLVSQAKLVKAGTTVKMIVSEREFQGRQSYTVLKIME